MAVTVTGWLFDIYPANPRPRGEGGMTLWFLDSDGAKYTCFTPFVPSFILHLNDADRRRIANLAGRAPARVSFTPVERKELYSNDTWNVLQVHVHDPQRFKDVVRYFERFFPHFAFFNADIPPAQLFFYETNLFPLGFGEYRIDDNGRLAGWTLDDSREALEYTLPPMAVMTLRNANGFVPPKYHRHIQLELSYEGNIYTLEEETPVDLLNSLNWHLNRYDPDVLVTEYGDALLLPKITDIARRYRVPMLLNRDQGEAYRVSRESSFFQYGRVVHKDGAFELAGRWHVDIRNSFTAAEAELEGVYELARLTQMPVQHQSRASIGTGLSSLQLSWAYRNNYLIPAKKREPEEFKSGATLMLADRGGLIYQPPVGYHEDIAELDFVSMYPSIMVNRNVSPETVNCRCCHNEAVPELGYTICEKREGIVAATLRSVVEKRTYYKQKKKFFKGKNPELYRKYDRRQNALKWMLVSCFGYLGYKNARFGRIEAHESVNAFSRDMILTAKEMAEAQGYELVHAIIDCVWLRKKGATGLDYERLAHQIAQKVGIDISLEGIYKWIVFPASKMDPVVSTANRYTGWYRHGEAKVRGIEARRRDTPRFIKNLQAAMLEQMSHANNVSEVRGMVPALIETGRNYIAHLQSGRVNPMELVLRRHITKEAEEYSNNSISAVVAKMVEAMGVHLAAGESIEFIIIDQSGKKQPEKAKPLALYALEDGYDIEKYTELALKAIETLLLPFGYDMEKLKEEYGLARKVTRQPKKRPVEREEGLSLFEVLEREVPDER
jgi:DNA polymerase-2